jgi:PAS domain S-box-containing protein
VTLFAALRSRFSNLTAHIGSVLSFLVGTLVLLGWGTDNTTLKSFVSGYASMKPNAALGFVLLGVALSAFSYKTQSSFNRSLAIGAAGAVVAIGSLTSLEYVLNWNPGFDEWLFRESSALAGPGAPGRMGLNSAIAFACLGAALLMKFRKERACAFMSDGLVMGAMLLAFIVSLGYLYEERFLYGIGRFNPMALHAALTLLVVGIGILSLHPDRGMMAVVTSEGAGGYMLRRLLPGALLVLPAIGWIRLYGERQGLYGTAAGVAFFATLATATLFLLLWWTAQSLNDADLRRGQTAAALSQSEQRRRLAMFVVDHAGDGILWANMEQRFIYVNESACRSLGYSSDELRGLTIADIVPHHDPERYAERLVLLKQGQAVHYESQHRRKDGTIFPVEVSLNYLEHAGRGFTCAIARDITERKAVEEALQQAREELEHRVEERTAALRESQEQLELILDATSVATWDWDVTTGAVQYNERWAASRGLSFDEVIPHVSSWSNGVHPEDRVHVMRALEDCLEGKVVLYEAEMRVQTAAGEWTWIMGRGRVIKRDAQGRALRMAGIEIDITARKRTEQELEKAKAFVMSVLENIPNMIFIKDAKNLRFVELNKAGEDLLGYCRDEMIGKNDYDFFPPDEADFFTQKDREVLESGRLWDIPSEPIQTRYRGTRILHTKKIPLCDESGKPHYLVGISEDITERQMMEEALRASEERYSSLISQATDVIYTAGVDGRFTYVNAAACAIMGYQEKELLGKHYLELIRPDAREMAQRFYKQQIAERTPSTYLEFPAVTKQGREIWFGQRVQLRLAGERIIGVEAITRDITARRLAEQALEEGAKCAAFAAEVSLLLNRDEPLDWQLQRCTDAAVKHLGAAFTRIWLREPGDLCAECHKASWCQDRIECLHLHASSGLSTNLNGEYRRIPMGALKVGRIAQGAGALFTNHVAQDERLPNKAWLEDNGLHSFAGFPLIVDNQVYGVFATFGREEISEAMRQTMESVCNGLATAIARKRAETERQEAYDRLREVTRQLAQAEEGERRRIARELHDEFGQALTGLKLDVAWLAKRLAPMTTESQSALLASKTQAMLDTVDGLIQSVRETAASLRPGVLDDLGLVAAIEWLVSSFRERTGLPCDLTVDPGIQRLSLEGELSTTVFRSAQELLTNVMRHARASTVSVELSLADSHLTLKVCDDGRGIQDREWNATHSLGLRGLHERVKSVGGIITIVGAPGEGTDVTLVLPVKLGAQQGTKEFS